MSTVATRKPQRQDIEKLRRQEMLLGIIYLFSPLHREISLLQIRNSINRFQRKLHLGYSFTKHFSYSDKLIEDLEDLIDADLLRECTYKDDSFSPEGILKLTINGKDKGKESVSKLPIDILEYLELEYLEAI